ncbi:MAG: MotA/TolQ/ExbB proton channel family protein, partial [Gammaproteobacteria bacterium]
FITLAKDPKKPLREIDDNLDETILGQQPMLNKRIWILDTVITLGPLLGLLGTIIGKFDTFSVLGNIQSGGATSQVSGGIAVALVTTGIGILVACLGLIFFNPINTRIRSVMHQMETVKTILMNRLRTGRQETAENDTSEDLADSAKHSGDFEDSTEHLF